MAYNLDPKALAGFQSIEGHDGPESAPTPQQASGAGWHMNVSAGVYQRAALIRRGPKWARH